MPIHNIDHLEVYVFVVKLNGTERGGGKPSFHYFYFGLILGLRCVGLVDPRSISVQTPTSMPVPIVQLAHPPPSKSKKKHTIAPPLTRQSLIKWAYYSLTVRSLTFHVSCHYERRLAVSSVRRIPHLFLSN